MLRDLTHPRPLRLLAALTVAGLTFGALPARAQDPVVEVLTPGTPQGGPVRSPARYDARGRRLPDPRQAPGPIVVQPPPVILLAPPPSQPPPLVEPLADPPPVDLARQERRRGNVYAAFGAQSGLALGLGAGLALSIHGEQERVGRVVAGLGAPLLAVTLAVLLRRWARADHWREGPGQAMAGIYPGAIQGGLFAASIVHAFGFEDQQVHRTLGLAIGATTLLSMVLHRHAEHRAAKRAGLYYVTVLLATLVAAPFARAYDRPEAMLYAATAAGAAHLVLTGLAPTLRW